ncbi:hypothetical protein F4820DRAFT_417733 [Hypoxylon rubiginosum]|uniref:Uncharacterized protein n=1 Tax=Hypoxylon rubiginosum TaxID=110542 RepID=A0ACB9Z319_9PEZI|nr:hypothetical protein F4820DRAFT_417733 [Hypoxylon rubiginosum]
MYVQHLAAAAFLLSGPQWLAEGQEPQQAQVPLEGCDALACSSTTSNSVCSTSNQPDDVTQTTLVGIASNAVNLTSDAQLSLTLVEAGRTQFGNAPGLEAYERTLYAGLPSSLLQNEGTESNRLPAACALMLQYQSQTFPIPDESTRDGSMNGTTSCAGILDQDCLDRFTSFVTSFDSSSSNDSAMNCVDLASHVNTQIHTGDVHLCNFYANPITVTGAPLLNTSTGSNNDEVLTQDECRPTSPQSNSLYRVGSVQTIVEDSDERFGGDIFGSRQGYTPIITAVYDGQGGNVSSVQFACMQALRKSGEVLEDTSAAYSRGRARLVMSILVAMATAYALL